MRLTTFPALFDLVISNGLPNIYFLCQQPPRREAGFLDALPCIPFLLTSHIRSSVILSILSLALSTSYGFLNDTSISHSYYFYIVRSLSRYVLLAKWTNSNTGHATMYLD